MCGSVWNSGTVYLYTTIKQISKGEWWLGSLDFKAIREPTSLELRNICGDLTFCSAKKCGCSDIFIKNQDGSSKSLTQREHPTFIVFLTSCRYAMEKTSMDIKFHHVLPNIKPSQNNRQGSSTIYTILLFRCLYEFVKLTMVSRLYPPGFRDWIWLDTFLPGSGRKKQYPRCHSGLKIDRLMSHLDPFSHSSAA